MRYPGGKGKCYQHLINLMPPHETYIESHLGGGAIMRNKLPACRNIGIDLDPRALSLCSDVGVPELELHEQDAVEFLRAFTFTGQELVYADPPYFPKTRRRPQIYRYEYTVEHHVELLETLCSLSCHVVLSGYDNALYRDKLAGWRHVTFQATSHVGLREESVWMNYAEPSALHDARFLGSNFRERQAIQRRQATLRKRLYGMSAIERAEFVHWVNATFPHPRVEVLCNAPA